jgi:hypothetical protein
MASSMMKKQWKDFKINKVMEEEVKKSTSMMESASGRMKFTWLNKFWGLLAYKLK